MSLSVKKSIAIIIIIVGFLVVFSPKKQPEYIQRGGITLEFFKEKGGCKYFRYKELVMKQCN